MCVCGGRDTQIEQDSQALIVDCCVILLHTHTSQRNGQPSLLLAIPACNSAMILEWEGIHGSLLPTPLKGH